MKNNIYNLISGPFSSERKAFEEWGLHDIYRAGVNEADFYNEIKYPVPEDNCFDRDAVFYVETGKGYGNLIEILKRAKAVNQRGKPVKIKFSEGVLDIVNKDIRYTGKRRGEWTEGGAHYVRNQYGYVDRLHRMENNEFVYVVDQYPFGEDTTVEDIEKYLWTTPDEFDYEDVKRQ